jgi:hypothetical protein
MKSLSWPATGLAISIALTGGVAAQEAVAGDEARQFVGAVLAATEDTWHEIFKAEGKTYQEPKLVLFSAEVASACGPVPATAGPTYCAADRKIYLDPAYLAALEAQGIDGDFAAAFLIAREVGHHVQNLAGILPKFEEMKPGMDDAEALKTSIRIELQADCFSGIWGYDIEKRGLLEPGDLQEALDAASKLADDKVPERPAAIGEARGTALQRTTWLRRGFASGKLADCDTFNNPI